MNKSTKKAVSPHDSSTKWAFGSLISILLSVVLGIVVLVACTDMEPETEKKGQEEKPFVIGLVPEVNIFKQIERYEPLANYLSKKTGMHVKLKVLTGYGNIIDNFVSEKMDGAFFGSFSYALAHANRGVVPLARPVNIDGRSTYHGVLFVRKDSGIENARDMQGKTFAFVDKATTAGYLLPLAYFKAQGIEDPGTYFKQTYFAGTHENAIRDVLNKQADIGAAKNTVYQHLLNIESRVRNELVVIERSPDVPENGLAIRSDLASSVMFKIKNALTGMHKDPEGMMVLQAFGAKGFIETTDEDYKNVYRYARQIGLDLKTYNSTNDQ
jgi:phosphonate transport system substrate-binding protein